MKQLIKELAISVTGVFSLSALVLFIAFSVPMKAQSAEIELTLGGWSKHLGAPDGYDECKDGECKRVWDWKNYYNESHNTIAIKYKNWEVGTLINSHHKRSVMVNWVPRWDINEYVSYGVRLGGATGYPNTIVSPVVQPHVVAYYRMVGLELGWLPDLNSRHPYGVATLSGKVRF